MATSKSNKQKQVDLMRDVFERAMLVVVFYHTRLNGAGAMDFRAKMRDSGGQVFVTKNTLTRIAIGETSFRVLADQFVGVTAIAVAFDDDTVVSVSKCLQDFMRSQAKGNAKILRGSMGDKLISADDVKTLANLPSIDILRARLIGVIGAPATKIARVVKEPGSQIARLLVAERPAA